MLPEGEMMPEGEGHEMYQEGEEGMYPEGEGIYPEGEMDPEEMIEIPEGMTEEQYIQYLEMNGQLPEGEHGMYPEGEMGYEEYDPEEMEGEGGYEELPHGMIPIQPGDPIPEGYQQIADQDGNLYAVPEGFEFEQLEEEMMEGEYPEGEYDMDDEHPM